MNRNPQRRRVTESNGSSSLAYNSGYHVALGPLARFPKHKRGKDFRSTRFWTARPLAREVSSQLSNSVLTLEMRFHAGMPPALKIGPKNAYNIG